MIGFAVRSKFWIWVHVPVALADLQFHPLAMVCPVVGSTVSVSVTVPVHTCPCVLASVKRLALSDGRSTVCWTSGSGFSTCALEQLLSTQMSCPEFAVGTW